MKEETKCYCGHTTTCDCGPEQDFKDIELPQQERQETPEEAAERLAYDSTEENKGFPSMKRFIEGAKWQQECMITKSMQMDAEMAYDSLPKQDKIMERFIANAKQETLGEAATKLLWKKYPYHPPRDSGYWQDMFIEGAKWQQERSYSEEEVNSIFYAICKHSFFEDNVETVYLQNVKDEFEQFKKK